MSEGLRSDVEAFVQDWFAGFRKLDRTDILGSTGYDGDDAWEFFEAFAEEFNVDLDEFPAYMHFIVDEPPSFRRVRPVDLDGRTIPIKPVSLDMLVEAAEAGRWMAEYPAHQVHVSRLYEIAFAVFLVSAIAAVVQVFRLQV